MDKIRLSDAPEIEAFLAKYQGTPLDWPLRKKWLNYLAKRKRKALYLKFFVPNSNARFNCLKLNYQLDAGLPESVVLKEVTQWWLVGKSQDKACDPLFKKWQKSGYQTADVVWQRLALAADGGKHTLIPYLTSLLPKEEQYLGRLWHKVRRDPAYISKFSRFSHFNEKETQIVAYGLKRLVWRDPNRAISTFNNAKKKFPFKPSQLAYLNSRFALALASKQHKQADFWLDQVSDEYLDTNLVQWKLANVLKSKDWQAVMSTLLALPKSKQESPQWQYWYARSLAETGQSDVAKQHMAKLATTRHYYGFLAANQLQLPINLAHKPLNFSQDIKQKAFEHPAAKRAFELFHIERYSQARKEWNYWLSQLPESEKLVAAIIAYEEGWFDRPIFTLAKHGYLDDVDLRFPMAYAEDINSYSKKHDIDASWAFAIARRESSFMRDAHSSAGAKGLMQIMPATAKQLEKRTISNRYLLNAKNNINLGTKYLKRLLKRNNGNTILATASYNAGPYRVKQWLSKAKNLPADIWIETIPFKETRDYVKSVLAYQQIYQTKLNTNYQSPFKGLLEMTISP
ncbi:transglycosylase SLT domain-containing protein [Thalassotalea sp. M1531]|uniref:Transglycosylase SLT domain-containing protein n=1 Tax=Thalassotalea algicola TaxID=2716224 RepID=A0A7Y0Q798_9GAMM|nr:transglycosylase SLT domain-containing protein [Thalassotalea algicola]NMP30815.1 transglycosylase SLT domain-containing protein [Thalassotalea algicola]